MKEKKEDINIEEDNEQTKIKNNTINKKTSRKNQDKMSFKSILDFFNK